MRASHGLPVQFLFSYFSASQYTSILAECVEPAAQDRAPILFHNARSFEYYNAGGINTIVCVCCEPSERPLECAVFLALCY